MGETALASAFAKSKYHAPFERSLSLASRAWAKYPEASQLRDRERFVCDYWNSSEVFAAIKMWRPELADSLVEWLISFAQQEIERRRPEPAPRKAASGQATRPHGRRTKARIALAQAVGAIRDFDQSHPTKVIKAEIDRRASAAAQNIPNLLKTFSIEGIPLGQCTARLALSWADRQEVNIEWVRMLCHGIPPNSLDDPLERWYGGHPDEVFEIWTRANSQEARSKRESLKRAAQKLLSNAEIAAHEAGDTPYFRSQLRTLARVRASVAESDDAEELRIPR